MSPSNLSVSIGAICLFWLSTADYASAIPFGDIVEPEEFDTVGCVHIFSSTGSGADAKVSMGIGTGTLIQPDIVITAAHVVRSARTPGHLRFRLDGNSDSVRGIAYQIHRGFDALELQSNIDGVADDIALIRLDRSLPKELTYYPLLDKEKLAEGTQTVIVGYGRNESQTNNVRRSGALKFYREFKGYHCFVSGNDRNQMGDHGDSGGPILVKRGPSYMICSLVQGADLRDSASLAEALKLDAIDVGFFVSVERHREWLKKRVTVLNNLQEDESFAFVPRTKENAPSAYSIDEVIAESRTGGDDVALIEKIEAAGLCEPITAATARRLVEGGCNDDFVQKIKSLAVKPFTFEELRTAVKENPGIAYKSLISRGIKGGLSRREIKIIEADGVSSKFVESLIQISGNL